MANLATQFKEELFELNTSEMENLRRAANARQLKFDPERVEYTASELRQFGLVREAYNSGELAEYGFDGRSIVTSFDESVRFARNELTVETPFGSGIRKWQLPFDECEWRILMTEFAPKTNVTPHVHPAHSAEKPGGSFRLVVSGSIMYLNKKFNAGDWFYIPNGAPYSFSSDPEVETFVMYTYSFFEVSNGNRFSHPHSTVG